jgi:pimeloyl-ACP methyl ester carboxylesterase
LIVAKLETSPPFLALADGSTLAYRHLSGSTPGILFCPGYNSDMQGQKALALEAWCRAQGRQFTRFDYFGHGQSDGRLEQGCIGRWRDDTLAILDEVTSGPQLIVGSSMGGWIMLLVALARRPRICGLVGVAAAADFTEALREGGLNAEQMQQLESSAYCEIPNCYDDGEPYPISRLLLEEGREHLLLDAEIAIDVPVRLIQGQCDPDVPWRHALTIAEQLRSTDVEVQLLKSGDHRLSEPPDLERLLATVEALLPRVSTNGL